MFKASQCKDSCSQICLAEFMVYIKEQLQGAALQKLPDLGDSCCPVTMFLIIELNTELASFYAVSQSQLSTLGEQ